MLEYTYPDGSGTGGTFTDGDQFSRETIQTIIDNVVATTRADTEQRLINILKTLMHDDTECDWGCENYGCGNGYYDALIERLNGGNK